MQVLFLFFAYGFILFKSSNLISEGSELLLLVPSLAGLVGSVVLPVRARRRARRPAAALTV